MSEKTGPSDSQKQYAMVSFSVAVITDMAIDVCKRISKKIKKNKKSIWQIEKNKKCSG